MKNLKYLSLMLAIVLMSACKSQNAVASRSEVPQTPGPPEAAQIPTSQKNPQPDMLTGPAERSDLQEGKFGEWFNPFYASYRVDESLVDELKPLLKDVDITLFMGTWCGDSKRETPRIYKILDAAGKTQDIELITVDRSKTTPQGLEEGKDIKRVPTLILSKDGKELGRIVEYPIESLEADMLKILKGEPYKHAYAD
ncbi:thioredoxin family protein [Leeuwenhoekiella nanhaiensis]|uniref:Thiol reductase thioredoxin n=1 Tax=Leeuwenhoekiella nanhaiensis TaxID=1655491 RepID=A0A2G1VN57_9FLAO|nr:thioredoxin family protein [Leeuwenhoekiella nanhaiensis]PHQ28040.1 thiol reductase thioredoxin [Leeuwenhoekiella nanhaiensis]